MQNRTRGGKRVCAVSERLESRVMLSFGQVDTGFAGGAIIAPPASGVQYDLDVAQPDGRVVAASRIPASGTGIPVYLSRFNPDGQPDASFASSGTITLPNWSGASPAALVLQDDGRLIAVGNAYFSFPQAYVTRVKTDGTIDSTFDANIAIALGGGKLTYIEAVSVQPDGRVLLAGGYQPTISSPRDFAIGRFNADGTLDTTFGTGGFAVSNFGGDALASTVLVQPDGNILVGGYGSNNGQTVLARYSNAGTLDTTFNQTGSVVFTVASEGTRSLSLLSSGKIVVFTSGSANDWLLARLNPDGSFDTTFGKSGMVQTSLYAGVSGTGGVVEPDGTLVVYTNTSTSPSDLELVRFNVDGTPDGAVGTGGQVVTSAQLKADAITARPDGRLVVAGSGLVQIDFDANPPTANAAGPYTVPEGGTVSLWAGASLDPAGGSVLYEWDYNYDGGSFTTDATGLSPGFSAAALNLDGPSTHTIALRLTDSVGHTSLATATLNVTDVPPTLLIGGPGVLQAGMPYTLNLSATDPGPDPIYRWDINWGDGDVQDFPGNPSSVTHVYQNSSRVYPIAAMATDPDGTFAATHLIVDTSLGGNGEAHTVFTASGNDQPSQMAVLPGGKILVVGRSMQENNGDLTFARYLPDGAPDPSFGTNGELIAEDEYHVDLFNPVSLTVQPDGKFIIGSNYFLLRRFNPDGSFDTTFANNGVSQITYPGGYVTLTSILQQSNGDVLAVGYSNIYGANGGTDPALMVVRYTAAGALDPTFGMSGIVRLDQSGAWLDPTGAQLDSSGNLVVAGSGNAGSVMADRLTSSGALDPTFGTGGVFALKQGDLPSGIVILPTGRILLHGYHGTLYALTPGGALDNGFGTGGIINPPPGWGGQITLTPDGKLLEYGTQGGSLASGLRRRNADGLPDLSFGQGGEITDPFYSGQSAGPAAVAFTDADKVLVANSSFNQISNDFCVSRYNSDGSLDTAFGGTVNYSPVGRALTDFIIDGTGSANAAAFQSDGKMVVVGSVIAGEAVISLARYKPDGSLDRSFGSGGTVSRRFENNIYQEVANTVALQPDGKIVIAGTVGNQLMLARYNPDGLLDGGFGGQGRVINPTGRAATTLAIQPDGRIVVAGYGVYYNSATHAYDSMIVLATYNSDGSPDLTFGNGGTVTRAITTPNQVADRPVKLVLQADGRIVVAGSDNGSFALLRYDPDGSLDANFGNGGEVTTAFGSTNAAAYDVLIQGNGDIVAAGASNWQVALTRYLPSGSLDPTFGSGGKVITTSLGNALTGIALQTDGKIVATATSTDLGYGLARYNTDGSLDTSFGTAGLFFFHDLPGASTYVNGMTLGPSGRLIVFAQEGTLFAVAGFIASPPGTLLVDVTAPPATLDASGVLTINGSDADDIINIASDSVEHLLITVDGDQQTFSLNSINAMLVNGNSGNDVITIDSISGDPLPGTVRLNGTFTLNGLQGTNPLAGISLDIGRSTVYVAYADSVSDPIAAIQGYLKNGYNSGAWNGAPTASTGVIASTPAAQNAAQTTAIGCADSTDGLIAGQPANTIELKYTLYGDTFLTASVGFNDFTRLHQHYNQTTGGTWDTGDFNYDGSVNFNDFALLTRNYNTSLGSQAAPSIQASSITTTPITSTVANSGKHSLSVQTKPTASAANYHKPAPKHPKKHRR